jgi:hypothetical protein
VSCPYANTFLKTIKNPADFTRPAGNYGTSVTPGTNAYDAYAQLIDGSTAWAATDGDGYELHININSVFVTTAAHASAITIGIDLAGGTTYTDWIVDLLGGPAGDYAGVAGGNGVNYRFPLRVPNGASLAAKGTRSVGTTAFRVACKILCKPTHPELIRYGSFVRTFGATGGGSPNGTVVTSGTAAEGNWATLASSIAEDLWYWELGMGVDSAGTALNVYLADLGIGDGSNKKIAIDDAEFCTQQTENLSKAPAGRAMQAKAGDNVYCRAQVGPNAASTNVTFAAYGVGG